MKKISVFIIISLVFLARGSSVDALELGVAGVYGIGNFSFTSKPYLFPEREVSGTIKKAGIEIVMDSGLLKDDRFNVRFSVGYERAVLDVDEYSGSESFNCFNTDLAFGIGLITIPSFRVWMGPEMRYGLANGNGEDITRDVAAQVVGFGALVGADIYLDDNSKLSLSAGAKYERYNSNAQFKYGTSNDLEGDVYGVYLKLAFLYRIKTQKVRSDNISDPIGKSLR